MEEMEDDDRLRMEPGMDGGMHGRTVASGLNSSGS